MTLLGKTDNRVTPECYWTDKIENWIVVSGRRKEKKIIFKGNVRLLIMQIKWNMLPKW